VGRRDAGRVRSAERGLHTWVDARASGGGRAHRPAMVDLSLTVLLSCFLYAGNRGFVVGPFFSKCYSRE